MQTKIGLENFAHHFLIFIHKINGKNTHRGWHAYLKHFVNLVSIGKKFVVILAPNTFIIFISTN